MLSPNELRRIVAAADDAGARGAGAALATVVAVDGSSYRRPGARMLVLDDGATVGGVSGGCLEADVRRKAAFAMIDGHARVVRYDTSDEDDGGFGTGLGCGGVIDILIEPLASGPGRRHVEALRAALASRRPLALGLRIAGPVERLGVIDDGDPVRGTVFVDHLVPIPRLIAVGAGPDVEPLAACAVALGHEVVVVDERPGYLHRRRLPEPVVCATSLTGLGRWQPDEHTACVVATHHVGYDARAVEHLLRTPAMYLGLLGPRHRTARVMAEVRRAAPQLAVTDRFRAPVGLDLGGTTPEQIALAILAEIEAVRNRRAAGFLRDRAGPIHEATPESAHAVPPGEERPA